MKISAIVYFSILFAGVVIGAWRYKYLLRPAKILFYLIVFILLKESVAFTISFFGYNLFFYQYLSLIDFVIISVIFLVSPELKGDKWIIISATSIISIFYVINLLFLQPPGKIIDSNFKLIKGLFLVLYSMLIYRRLLEFPSENIFGKSIFWIASGILVFNVVNIFYWGIFNYYLGNKKSVLLQIRPFFDFANYIMYISFSVSIYLNKFSNSKRPIIQ